MKAKAQDINAPDIKAVSVIMWRSPLSPGNNRNIYRRDSGDQT